MSVSTPIAAALALIVGLGAGRAAGDAHDLQGTGRSLPPGVHAESGNRLPLVTRDRLDGRGQQSFDAIQADMRAGRLLAGLYGPVGIRLWSPRVGDAALQGNLYLRFDSRIGRRTYEIAVLTTARELDSQFEWTAHEPAALKAGVEPTVIEIIKRRTALATLNAPDRLVIQIGREVLSNRTVALETFDEALRTFGETNLVDIVSVIADYAGTAVLLNAFDQQLPAGQAGLLPAR